MVTFSAQDNLWVPSGVRDKLIWTRWSVDAAVQSSVNLFRLRLLRVIAFFFTMSFSTAIVLALLGYSGTPLPLVVVCFLGTAVCLPMAAGLLNPSLTVNGVILTIVTKASVSLCAYYSGSVEAIHYLFISGSFFLPIIAAIFAGNRAAVVGAIVCAAEYIIVYWWSPPESATAMSLHGQSPEDFLLSRVVIHISFVVAQMFIGVAYNVLLARALDALTEVAETRRQFLTNMSHEIRTPLVGILGIAELLLNEPQFSDDARRKFEILLASGQGLLHLFNNILDASRLQFGALALEDSVLNIRKTAESVINIFSAVAHTKQIELTFHVDDDVPRNIESDQYRVIQILNNIVGNGIKFTDRGRVHLHVYSNMMATPPQVCFSIQDTGVGIPPYKRSTLFQPFSQSDQTSTRKFGGSGLGLALCTQVAEMLGGSLSVTSQEGVGSTFTLSIPMGNLDAIADVPSRSAEDVRRRESIEAAAAAASAGVNDVSGSSGVNIDPPTAATPETFETASGMRLRPRERQSRRSPSLAPLQAYSPAPQQQQQQPQSRVRRSLLIHVAEDNALNAAVVRRQLERFGHSCVIHTNGRHVAESFSSSSRKPDLILMDLHMPDMDGIASTQAIRRIEMEMRSSAGGMGSGPRVPIVALTAATAEEQQRCYEAGMDAFLTKPVTMKELERCVSYYCRE